MGFKQAYKPVGILTLRAGIITRFTPGTTPRAGVTPNSLGTTLGPQPPDLIFLHKVDNSRSEKNRALFSPVMTEKGGPRRREDLISPLLIRNNHAEGAPTVKRVVYTRLLGPGMS